MSSFVKRQVIVSKDEVEAILLKDNVPHDGHTFFNKSINGFVQISIHSEVVFLNKG